MIVPGIDEELPILSKNKKILPELFLPNCKIIKICNNKWKFYNFCIKNNICVPHTSLAEKFNQSKHTKKVIFKPINGRGSKGLIISKNNGETYLTIKLLKQKKILNNYIIQDYMDGLEYTVTCSNLGEKNIFFHSNKQKKGITIKAIYKNDKNLIKEIQKLNKILKKQIIFNIQLIKKQNKYYVIKINPRISTTFCLFLKNKFDPFSPGKLKKINIVHKNRKILQKFRMIKLKNNIISRNINVLLLRNSSNHNNKLSYAYKMIDLAKKCGADAVKFQTFKGKHFSKIFQL